MSTNDRTIQLDQFLKSVGAAQSGGQAKHLVQDGMVKVNGELETRRGRKLSESDLVTIEGKTFTVSFNGVDRETK